MFSSLPYARIPTQSLQRQLMPLGKKIMSLSKRSGSFVASVPKTKANPARPLLSPLAVRLTRQNSSVRKKLRLEVKPYLQKNIFVFRFPCDVTVASNMAMSKSAVRRPNSVLTAAKTTRRTTVSSQVVNALTVAGHTAPTALSAQHFLPKRLNSLLAMSKGVDSQQ
jgi:hypothetical protein